MPLMIGLTLRAAKHKKPTPVIPKGPMFHEDINIDINDRGEEIQIETSYSNNFEAPEVSVSLSSHESVSPKPNVIFVKPHLMVF